LKLVESTGYLPGAILYLARAGNLDQAQKLSEKLDHDFPRDTVIRYYCLPAIRAAIKLRQNQPQAAVDALQPAEEYDTAYTSSFDNMYPAYLRGLAFLQLGNGKLAATEFQKVLDHPGIVAGFITGALARLQIARAQAMEGDTSLARKSYESFLSLWKDADPDIPIYKQAKAEYAQLSKN
jgi:outer membrane protein assembly factor BamD (BamD/ComL family)